MPRGVGIINQCVSAARSDWIVQSGMLDSRVVRQGGTQRWRLGSEFLAPVDHFQICLDEGADAGHMCPSRGGCLAYVFDEYILPIFADFPVKMKRGKALTRGFSRGGNFRGNPDGGQCQRPF